MFREEIIEAIKSKYMTLKSLSINEISLNGSSIPITSYDIINMALVQHNVFSGNGARLSIVSPPDIVMTLLNVLAVTMQMCELDLEDHVSELAQVLESGDLVKLDGCLGEFVEYDEERGFSIRFKKPNKKSGAPFVHVLKSEAHHIIRYEGNATALNHYRDKHRMDISTKVIAEIMSVNTSIITNLLHKRRILLIADKSFAEALGSLRIKKSLFSSIFPVAYYSSHDHKVNIGHRASQKRPNVCIVPNMSVAYEFCRRNLDDPVNTILISGYKYFHGHASTLEQLSVDSIILENRASEFEQCSNLTENGFDIWFWSDADLAWVAKNIDTVTEYTEVNSEDSDSLQIRCNKHKKVVKQGPPAFTIHKFSMPENWNDKTNSVVEKINILNDIAKELHTSELIKFIKYSWNELINLNSAPYSLFNIEQINDATDVIVNHLRNLEKMLPIFDGSILPGKARELPLKICRDFETLIKELRLHNPRAKTLIDLVEKDDVIPVVIVRHAGFIKPTTEFLKKSGVNISDVIRPVNITSNDSIKPVIISAWLGRKKVSYLHDCHGRNYEFLLSANEVRYMNSYLLLRDSIVQRYCQPERRSELLGLSEQLFIKPVRTVATGLEYDKIEMQDPDDLLSSLVTYSLSVGSSFHSENPAQDDIVSAYRIDFEEDSFGYFTEGYQCRVVELENSKFKKCSISELIIGDQLIFSSHSNRDIFAILITSIENRPEMKEIIALSEEWWRNLKRYMESKGISSEDVSEKLESLGLYFSPDTVDAWIRGDRIKPGSYSVIEAIASFAGDENIFNSPSEIKKACSKRLSTHIKAGRYLVRQITRAAVHMDTDDDRIDPIIKQIVLKISEYAQIMTVCSIWDESVRIPRSECNRIIED